MRSAIYTAAVLFALWGAVEHYALEKARSAHQRDPYFANVQPLRLAGAIEAVPPDAVVGYITDLQPGTVAALAAFNTASYALAPRLLVPATDKEWVLGNISIPQDYASFGASHGLRFVKDLGSGAVLYHGGAH